MFKSIVRVFHSFVNVFHLAVLSMLSFFTLLFLICCEYFILYFIFVIVFMWHQFFLLFLCSCRCMLYVLLNNEWRAAILRYLALWDLFLLVFLIIVCICYSCVQVFVFIIDFGFFCNLGVVCLILFRCLLSICRCDR